MGWVAQLTIADLEGGHFHDTIESYSRKGVVDLAFARVAFAPKGCCSGEASILIHIRERKELDGADSNEG